MVLRWMKIKVSELKLELENISSTEKRAAYQWFFKTGKGDYGEGDSFIGVTMPELHKAAKKYKNLEFNEIRELLKSPIHEHRMVGLLILVLRYEKQKKEVFEFYLENVEAANNWDLIDVTAPKVIGKYLLENPKEKDLLYNFANSSDLWKKRISIISTMTFIKNNQFEDAIKISEILIKDEHDLIHKAVGWMLREIGKKDEVKLKEFLNKHIREMSRTTLRYSIEKLDSEERLRYLRM